MAWAVLAVMVLSISGCAQKSESEKMFDQMNKDAKSATNQMKKDLSNL